MSAVASRKRSLFDSSGSEEEDDPSITKAQKRDIDSQKTPKKVKDESAGKKEKITLSPAQRARMEQNRQQALLIKQDKMNRRTPYIKPMETKKEDTKKVIRINDKKLIDSGGGFFIEENEGEIKDDDMITAMKIVTEPAPLFEEDRPFCEDCGQPFDNSYLFQKFGHPACDQCRDKDDKHSLITKSDAKSEYLLKDCDLEKREPVLKFIVRKNPHNSQWGDMKLYLKLQVEKRALKLWGTEEALEEAMEKKEDQRVVSQQKRFNKKMSELRMNVRSSLYTRATKNHEHEYGEEEYNEDEDEYSRTCKTCEYSYKYDKL